MFNSPSNLSCPTYVAATQISPNSVDEIPTQSQEFLTQEDRTLLFRKDGDNSNTDRQDRDYYEQLFSSDSDSFESERTKNSYRKFNHRTNVTTIGDTLISDHTSDLKNPFHSLTDINLASLANDSQSLTSNKSLSESESSSTLTSLSNEDQSSLSDMSISDSESPSASECDKSYFVSQDLLPNKSISVSESYSTLTSSSNETQSSSSDMSISDSESSSASECDKSCPLFQESSSVSSKDSFQNMKSSSDRHLNNFHMSEKEIDAMMGYKQDLPSHIKQENQNPLDTSDRIISFNIRNKYDHTIAGELMSSLDVTFAAFQEPYGAQNKYNKSWASFTKSELQSARYSCYATQYQVIIFDSMKWGGKVISEFQSFYEGRLTCIAFGFEEEQHLGIISLYACSNEVHSDKPEDKKINNQILKMIKATRSNWSKKFPNMQIIILGDFQETISISNKDNIGKFRKPKDPCGILSYVEETHISLVRDANSLSQYITRFGVNGGRGLDHIFVASDESLPSVFSNAKVSRLAGADYFPSDHSMLECLYARKGPHNNLEGIPKTKYDYSKIFRIRVKGSGKLGKDIELDDGQFKGSKAYEDQKLLFDKLQSITANESQLTNTSIDVLESRISNLYKELWKDGKNQKVKGDNNKLVEIRESQAIELAYIFREFQGAIKNVLDDLKLSSQQDNIDRAGRTRARLRKRNGFRLFSNLPISTKLRYLRTSLRKKLNGVRKALYWLDEFNIKSTNNSPDLDESELWSIRDDIVKIQKLEKQVKEIQDAYIKESEERANHIAAIQYMQNSGIPSTKEKCTSSEKHLEPSPNSLPYISDNLTNLINSWLKNSGCENYLNKANRKDPLQTLTSEIENWKSPITDYFDPPSMKNNHILFEKVKTSFNKCEKDLVALNGKITRIQTAYRKDTLQYFIEVNTIHSFTRKVLPKPRSPPATHSLIWDEKLQAERQCRNEAEELKATSEFHGKWMGDSKATENCAFAKVIRKGRLGPRGIELNPDRKLTMKDIPSLIKNGDKLPRRVKRAFLRAHNKHTANLFRSPKKPRKEFFYPFFLRNSEGIMNKSSFLESHLWKCLASIPGKARFDGFQLATIGRFGVRWRKVLLDIIKLMFIMRFIPADIRKIQRFPIPKPGKANEYRPISLCNDLYCFINAIQTRITSDAIEKCGLLHTGITSYRRGKSCATLVAVEQCFREDCFENNLPAVQIDEDEEKFFDRVCLEIILAVMKINGFPDQGFLELKACAMGEKLVEIITSKGSTFAKFICGLEQGNPDSPTIANLVIKLKHDVWKTINTELQEIFNRNKGHKCNMYKFRTFDPADGQLIICMIGYCDDNSKFLSAINEKDLLKLVEIYTQLAGDLSMVTKIGRKSSKCDVHFFNVSAAFTLKIKKCWSTAWSFVHDSPIEEEVPFKVCMKQEEFNKFLILSDYNNLSTEDQLCWDKIITSDPHRHLGLSGTLDGDTSATCMRTVEKMYEKIDTLKIQNMDTDSQRLCSNMLVASMHSYVPIQANYGQQELNNLDTYISSKVMKRNGISNSDCKHRIFLPLAKGGLGFKSTLEINLIALTRELEILSNGPGIDGWAFRSRLAAIPMYPTNMENRDIRNHARTATMQLALYGIHLRDKEDGIINWILKILAESDPKFASIGCPRYRDGNGFTIGFGREKNRLLAFGGQYHKYLRILKHHNWSMSDNVKKELESENFEIKIPKLLELRKKAGQLQFDQLTSFHSYYEWMNEDYPCRYRNIPNDKKEWHIVNLSDECGKNVSKEVWKWNETKIHDEIFKQLRLNLKEQVRFSSKGEFLFNKYEKSGRILHKLYLSKGPLIIATDGAHERTPHKSSAAFCICTLDIRPGETILSANWANRPMIPLYSRTARLPEKLGINSSDVASGECYAFVMKFLGIDKDLERITITDSNAIRNHIFTIRDGNFTGTDRDYIRNSAGGISKYLCGIIQSFVQTDEKLVKNMQPIDSELSPWCWFKRVMASRKKQFLEVAESWINEKTFTERTLEVKMVEDTWEEKYFDSHQHNSILKVNSHQLNSSGTHIKNSPRYKQLIPNLALLSANHHADRAAELGIKFNNFTRESTVDVISSTLRFFTSWNGRTIDKHSGDTLWEKFTEERLKRLRTKATQGLLWRTLHLSSTSWKQINPNKSLLRALLGLTNTHTRCIYKSDVTREGFISEFLSNIQDPERKESIEQSSTKNKLSYISECKRCVCNNSFQRHGNIRHMILYCNNHRIVSFRTHLLNLIEMRLKYLFSEIWNNSSDSLLIQMVNEVSNCFDQMQSRQEARLIPIPTIFNNQYITIQHLLSKHNLNNIQDALQAKHNIFLELFGIIPQTLPFTLLDSHLGTLDLPWLGLMPRVITKCVNSFIHKASLSSIHKKSSSARVWKENMKRDWKEILSLNMGRVIGLHNISGSHGKEIEKTYLDKLNAAVNITADSDITDASPICIQDDKDEVKQKKRKRSVPISEMKQCISISCGREHRFWMKNKTLTAYSIPIANKQCQRCTNYGTAMKASVQTLQFLKTFDEDNGQKMLLKLRTIKHSNRLQYNSLMDMLHKYHPSSEFFGKARFISKKRLSEKSKKICHILMTLFQQSTYSQNTSFKSSISEMIEKIQSSLCLISRNAINDKFIVKTLRNEAKSDTSSASQNTSLSETTKVAISPVNIGSTPTITNMTTINLCGTPNSLPSTNDSHVERPPSVSSDFSILARNRMLEGGHMQKAIAVLQNNVNTCNIYISSPETYITVDRWTAVQGWEAFARIFRSPLVIQRKPDGIYLLPFFTGPENGGHWFLIAIHKQGRSKQGVILDSLGKCNNQASVQRKLSDAFAPGRGNVRWDTDRVCIQQTELECGHRTILAMKIICDEVSKGSSFMHSVDKATLHNTSLSLPYEAAAIRKIVQELIQKFEPHMIAVPIRLQRNRRNT